MVENALSKVDSDTSAGQAERGWDSSFQEFGETSASQIIRSLSDFVSNLPGGTNIASSQTTAWKQSVNSMQSEFREVGEIKIGANAYGVILEYKLPFEFRCPDSILLLSHSVVVIEFKGDRGPTAESIDQTHAYARDLRAYHRECHGRAVHPILVPMQMQGPMQRERGVDICSPDHLDQLILDIDREANGPPLDRDQFLSEDAYKPLPSLISAARELFNSRRIRNLWQSVADTDEATSTLLSIIREAKATRTRRLALLTGVPGAGKTLVGLRVVHEPSLDDLADSESRIPAVFLSGNGPLVKVLQYELRKAGGGGKTFVKDVKGYVRDYTKSSQRIPNEHVVVFDEAQRAWDIDRIKAKHGDGGDVRTEPGHFVEFADRKDDWAVIVGLIGSGQEIHVGEEGGLALWREALSDSHKLENWIIHGPPNTREFFEDMAIRFQTEHSLQLVDSVRSHRAGVLHEYVDQLLDFGDPARILDLARQTMEKGFDFRISRNYDRCVEYIRARYEDNRDARYGQLVSSRAKAPGTQGMETFGFPNEFMSPIMRDVKNKIGEWYGNEQSSEISCCNLNSCATEFEAQGLELDSTLLCWGPDLSLEDGRWNINRMRRFKPADRKLVKNPEQLRANSYRVLLTRARDACVVYVPKIVEEGNEDILADTYCYLRDSGFRDL